MIRGGAWRGWVVEVGGGGGWWWCGVDGDGVRWVVME